jgi:single-stranded-DNA-specific exonuclease
LRERYNKPAILFSTPPDGPARGSARSVEGLHITDAIAAQADLLLGFGGHPMAAGLSLPEEDLPAFHRRLDNTIEDQLGAAAYQAPTLSIDAWLELENLSLEFSEQVERLAPFGAGNPPPTFGTRQVAMKSVSHFGRGREHLRLVVHDGKDSEATVVWWNGASESLPEGRFDLAYNLRARTFRGRRDPFIQLVDFRTIEPPVVEIQRISIEVVDLRRANDPMETCRRDAVSGQLAIFAEGNHRRDVGGKDRFGLQPAQVLALYTSPPGPGELDALIEAVGPQKICFIIRHPPAETPDVFLSRLAGMVKFAIVQREGQTSLADLAAATAQQEITVRLGLEWLVAGGHVELLEEAETLKLVTGHGTADRLVQRELYTAVRGLLAETVAYRDYLSTISDPACLFSKGKTSEA